MNQRFGSSRRPDSIKEALRMLDEALLSSDAGENIKSAISGISADAAESLRSASESLQELGSKALNVISDLSERGIEGAVENGREAVRYVDSRLRSNPWPIIGGVALGAFLIGVAIGTERDSRRHRTPNSEYRH